MNQQKILQIANNLQQDIYLLANDILNSHISPYIRISELITMLMKNVEVYRGLSGQDKREVVLLLGIRFITQYAPEADRDTLESLYNEDAKDLIELIISATRIVNRSSFLRSCFTCLS